MAAPDDRVVDVWWADLRSVDARLLAVLDDVEAGRMARIDRDADKGRFVLGVALLRVAVGVATGGDPRSVRVDRTCGECGGPHGAPRVEGVRVSVAHAGTLVLVGTAGGPVGVDVEARHRGDDVERWVLDEARFKTGAGAAEPTGSLVLPAPVPGYLGAVAVAGRCAPDVVTHDVVESAALLERLARAADPGPVGGGGGAPA